jgi:hypothetical protein
MRGGGTLQDIRYGRRYYHHGLCNLNPRSLPPCLPLRSALTSLAKYLTPSATGRSEQIISDDPFRGGFWLVALLRRIPVSQISGMQR